MRPGPQMNRVTGMTDCGTLELALGALPLRADERAGRILSPRIFATGNLITYPGSHGDRIALRISDFEKDKALLDRQRRGLPRRVHK